MWQKCRNEASGQWARTTQSHGEFIFQSKCTGEQLELLMWPLLVLTKKRHKSNWEWSVWDLGEWNKWKAQREMNHEVLVYEWRWYFQLLWSSHTLIHSRSTVITIQLNVIWKHIWGFNQNTGGNTSHKHTKKLSKRGHRFYLAILTCIT